ncbi:hypothetical protein CMI37_24155 [Candidatus Pacearchaeota archaeon]|nr:hypothetical protein [Candidatus Pacearchaeota archaeon]|tara:strand:+ start:1489 stop:1884 length:396 start_codon:yes stop_codon:yes gene_type:complete
MANHSKISIKGTYSKNSDFSKPKIVFDPEPYKVSASKFFSRLVLTEISVGVDLNTSVFDTISFFSVQIPSSEDNEIVLEFKSEGNGAVSNVFNIVPGGIFATTDLTPGASKLNLTDRWYDPPTVDLFIIGD